MYPTIIVDNLTKEDPLVDVKAKDVESRLAHLNLSSAVLRDCINELTRRRNIFANYARRKLRKAASCFGPKGVPFRRVIETYSPGRFIPGRNHEYHATKGWRNYRSEPFPHQGSVS